jgi:NADH:ubiquinone oxidoreductase subunit F (NADH-binding)/NADH:ubiquinone oxidoreductase subunit E
MSPEAEFLPPANVVDALKAIQEEHGWLEPGALKAYSEKTSTPMYRLHGVASFFPHFRREPPPRCEVAVCRDAACWLAGGEALAARAAAAAKADPSVRVHEVSCLGRCDRVPAFAVNDVPCGGSKDVARFEALLAKPPGRLPSAARGKKTYRCDPYAAPGDRWGALRDVLSGGAAAEEAAIAALKDSGLRGMGGAGFPTGMKWEFVRKAAGAPKFVVCNADESEPGTFKDREVLARLPHLVLEGMLLAARAVGARRVVLYVRHEYAPEEKRFREAVREAHKAGAVGRNVLGSGWDCEAEVFVSPGGYICGEETALLEAMEGRRAEPRNKPPFPGVVGLHGKPTLINNVETFAFVPWIVRRGGAAWKALGVNGGTGLKFVSVSGHVRKPQVVEVPMGTTVRGIIDLCGGLPRGKKLKAFSPGGSSSNFLPASAADTPMDFKAMADAGSMLGSGALFVVAEGTPMLPLALNVVRFFRNESCGKCVPCRVGTEKAVNILEDAAAGKPAATDLLPELHDALAMTSICGLGQAALNPILSAMKHFPDECGGETA